MNLYSVEIQNSEGIRLSFLIPSKSMTSALLQAQDLCKKWKCVLRSIKEEHNVHVEGFCDYAPLEIPKM